MKLQQEIQRIQEMMTHLTEQKVACTKWVDGTFVNGDGIKTPKITINNDDTKIEGIYEGPESGFCIQSVTGNKYDSVHQLATITVYHEGSKKHLKNLYKFGTYVRPDLKNIVMVRKPNYFKITIPLTPTTEDKAITSINERGSMGGGTGGIDYAEYNDVKKTYPEMFYDQLKTAGDITEHFFAFRNLNDYPIKTKSVNQQGNQQQNSRVNITGNDFGQFLKDIKTKTNGASIDENSVRILLDTENNNYSLTYNIGKTKINHLRLALNVMNDKINGVFPSKDKILKDFSGAKSIKDGTFDKGTRDYSVIMIP